MIGSEAIRVTIASASWTIIAGPLHSRLEAERPAEILAQSERLGRDRG